MYTFNPFTQKFDEVGDDAPNNGFTYAVNNWHSFTETYDTPTSRSLDANFLIGYQVWIKQEVTIDKIGARFTAGVAGNSVVGLYTTNENGTPNAKVLQSSTEFNNAVTGFQSTTLSSQIIVPAGVYWNLYLSSSTPTSAALNQNTIINSAGWNVGMTATNNVWFRALAYTSTLPATAGTGALGNYATVPFFTFLTV